MGYGHMLAHFDLLNEDMRTGLRIATTDTVMLVILTPQASILVIWELIAYHS